MSQIIETVEVDVPVTAAYNQWTRFESFPNFLSFVESITRIDDARYHWTVRVGGVTREFDAEVTEQHPDERIAWKSVGGEVSQAGVVTFHRLSDTSSRVTVQLDWEPEGFVETVGAALGIDNASVKGDLKNFKTFIEGQASEDADWRENLSD